MLREAKWPNQCGPNDRCLNHRFLPRINIFARTAFGALKGRKNSIKFRLTLSWQNLCPLPPPCHRWQLVIDIPFQIRGQINRGGTTPTAAINRAHRNAFLGLSKLLVTVLDERVIPATRFSMITVFRQPGWHLAHRGDSTVQKIRN